jgi:hypothetical protein
LQPCLGLAEQSRQPAMVFGRQVLIVRQFSAMHNNSPLAFNQEATSLRPPGVANHSDWDGRLNAEAVLLG